MNAECVHDTKATQLRSLQLWSQADARFQANVSLRICNCNRSGAHNMCMQQHGMATQLKTTLHMQSSWLTMGMHLSYSCHIELCIICNKMPSGPCRISSLPQVHAYAVSDPLQQHIPSTGCRESRMCMLVLCRHGKMLFTDRDLTLLSWKDWRMCSTG